jgi:hypothetical protein
MWWRTWPGFRGEALVHIDDLCVTACASLPRVERAIRDAFEVSPRRCLIPRRLTEMRGELFKGDSRARLIEFAARSGSFHLGHSS